VIIISALAIGLGTYSGGWRIMRAMGKGTVAIETPKAPRLAPQPAPRFSRPVAFDK
jgi:phosphate/sulfate permease